jgi:citrate synthase
VTRHEACPRHHDGLNLATRPLVEAVEELTGQRPNIDFALVAPRRFLLLPDGSAFGPFALGRSVGWIAHAMSSGRPGN